MSAEGFQAGPNCSRRSERAPRAVSREGGARRFPQVRSGEKTGSASSREEIRQAFADGLRKHFSADNVNYAKKGEAIAQAALEGNADALAAALSSTLSDYVSVGDDVSKRGTTCDLKNFLEPLLAGAERRGRIAGLRVESDADRATFFFTDGAKGVVMELRDRRQDKKCQAADEALAHIQENISLRDAFGPGYRHGWAFGVGLGGRGAWAWVEAGELGDGCSVKSDVSKDVNALS